MDNAGAIAFIFMLTPIFYMFAFLVCVLCAGRAVIIHQLLQLD